MVDIPFETSQHDLQQQLRAEQIRIVYQHIKPGIFASVFNGFLLSLLQWQTTDHVILLLWYSSFLMANVVRYGLVIAYERRQPDVEEAKQWGRYFVIGAGLSGASWGVAALILLPTAHPTQQVITMLVLAGTVAGATATLSALLRAFIIFSSFSLIPLLLHLVYLGGLIHYVLASFTAIFLAFMLISARRNNDILLTSLRLNFDNQHLLKNLQLEKQQAVSLNENLRTEIAQRLDAEQQLRRKEQNLEEAQRIAGLGSWELDVAKNRVYLSREMRVLLGLTPGRRTIAYEDFLQHILDEDRERVERSRHNAIQQTDSYVVEYRVANDNGHHTILEEQGIVRVDERGRVSSLSAIALDITQRQEMDRLKREFISMVSHELRTPLTAISGTLGLIEGGVAGDMPDKANELVGVAQRNALRLSKLVNDILDIDKLEFGSLPLELEAMDAEAMVREAIEENRGYADKLGVSIQFEAATERTMILGDRDRLIQVMTNLLSNAAKYSPNGASVQVGLKSTDGTLRIDISDQGPGIDESFRDRVFQKFSQGDTSDSRFQYGTGLGLNIAKLIVEKHGGSIGFDTVPGKGTTFWFELPRQA